MSEFSTESTLSLVVQERDLRRIRGQIEDALSDVAVGPSAGEGRPPEMAADGAGVGSGRAQRRARRSFRMTVEQTEYLEDAVAYLEEIEDHVSERDGGGGGIIDDLVGAVVETGGDAALQLSDTVLEVATDAAGTALGNAVADAVNSSTLDVEEPTLQVEKPPWVPIQVEDTGGGSEDPPNIAPPLEDLGEGTGDGGSPLVDVSPELNPDFSPEFHPEFSPEFNPEFKPEFNPTFNPTISPEIKVSPTLDLPDLNLGGPESQPATDPRRRPPPKEGDDTGLFSIGGEDGLVFGEGYVSIGGDNGIQVGRKDQGNSTNQSTRGKPSRDVSVTSKTDSRVTVDPSGLDRLKDEIISAVGDAQQENREELQDEIDQLESELEDLRNDITGR